MTISVTKEKIVALLACAMLVTQNVDAQENPHWKKSACQTCHIDASPVEGNIALNDGDAEALCDSCHSDRGDAISCRHNSDLADGGLAIPDNLRAAMKSDRIVCTTCHDISYQCKHPTVQYSFHNPGFLRDRKSRDEGQYCFECHESSGFEKLNPHSGVAGSPSSPTCALCHSSIPATDTTSQLVVEFNMKVELNDMCIGCHVVRPHPRGISFGAPRDEEGWVHLVSPSEKVLEKMRLAKAETGIGLPLNPQTGEIFCATCHNPHGFKAGNQGELQPKHRLRANDICQACHDK